MKGIPAGLRLTGATGEEPACRRELLQDVQAKTHGSASDKDGFWKPDADAVEGHVRLVSREGR